MTLGRSVLEKFSLFPDNPTRLSLSKSSTREKIVEVANTLSAKDGRQDFSRSFTTPTVRDPCFHVQP